MRDWLQTVWLWVGVNLLKVKTEKDPWAGDQWRWARYVFSTRSVSPGSTKPSEAFEWRFGHSHFYMLVAKEKASELKFVLDMLSTEYERKLGEVDGEPGWVAQLRAEALKAEGDAGALAKRVSLLEDQLKAYEEPIRFFYESRSGGILEWTADSTQKGEQVLKALELGDRGVSLAN